MAQELLVYISAATDLAAEREVLGRALAEIPCDVAFRVVQSPDGNGIVDEQAIATADVHVLVLGGDIRAPVGLEWQLAHRASRRPEPLLRQDTLRTLAGQNFVRLVAKVQPWQPFRGVAELRATVLDKVAGRILARPSRYGLTAAEIELLHAWRKGLRIDTSEVDASTRGGAGDSSRLLSRRQIATEGGILLEKPSGDPSL